MDFLSWGINQFVVQIVFHSAVIAVVVEAMISLWHIKKPCIQIRFRLLVLSPVVYLPFYFLFAPVRAGAHFREDVALINFNGWLRLRLMEDINLWHLFIILLVLTTFFFLLREVIPAIRYFLKNRPSLPMVKIGQFPKLDQTLANLAKEKYFRMPKIFLSTETIPMVYTLTNKALFISPNTINMLNDEELEVVIAHELAHISGKAYKIMVISLMLRFLTFYNPVALFIFRRIINDNEQCCDDIAVHVTAKQLPLASGLLKLFRQTAVLVKPGSVGLSRFIPRIGALEYRFHEGLIEERVNRLVDFNNISSVSYANLRLLVTAVLLQVMLFFVV